MQHLILFQISELSPLLYCTLSYPILFFPFNPLMHPTEVSTHVLCFYCIQKCIILLLCFFISCILKGSFCVSLSHWKGIFFSAKSHPSISSIAQGQDKGYRHCREARYEPHQPSHLLLTPQLGRRALRLRDLSGHSRNRSYICASGSFFSITKHRVLVQISQNPVQFQWVIEGKNKGGIIWRRFPYRHVAPLFQFTSLNSLNV